MPIKEPAAKVESSNGLDFTHVLRDCLSSAVVTVDDQHKVTAFNPRAESLLHLKAGNVLGKTTNSLPAPLQQCVEDAFSSGEPILERQAVLRNGHHTDLAIQYCATPVGKSGKAPSSVVLVFNDVSSARKWESSMRRLDRLHSVGTLSASMAHEVKNAFVAVKTFVDLLLEQNKQADLAEIVRLEMRRIDSILGQMRKFSGPAKPELVEVHLHLVLEKSMTLIQHLLEERKIRAVRSFLATHDLLRGDADQLEQAFINLFFNALDAMKHHGRLTVSTAMVPPNEKVPGLPHSKYGPLLRVTIHDNGTGIPPENMARLFEPFFTTKPDGTGLGLVITRRIVQEHYGIITVQSEHNKGTTFAMVLPTIPGKD
jgi:nitrogen-specific signal transduction histidine kinase